jgi:hypothetical protein
MAGEVHGAFTIDVVLLWKNIARSYQALSFVLPHPPDYPPLIDAIPRGRRPWNTSLGSNI